MLKIAPLLGAAESPTIGVRQLFIRLQNPGGYEPDEFIIYLFIDGLGAVAVNDYHLFPSSIVLIICGVVYIFSLFQLY